MPDDFSNGTERAETTPSLCGDVANLGEPFRFQDVENLAGVVLEAVPEGGTAKVCTALAITSDDPFFHTIASSMEDSINYMAQRAGLALRLQRANTVLLVIRADRTAELWVDSAAISMKIVVKRSLKAGTVIFEHDIADLISMSFPAVQIGKNDKVLCLFREGWRFGLAFDFNRNDDLDVNEFERVLGTLTRNLRYRHIYDALDNEPLLTKLISTGWFPFAEIITHEFKNLLENIEAGFDLSNLEQNIVKSFDEARIQSILDRWATKPHFVGKMAILKAALDAFGRAEPVAVIKILLTEIEGVLNQAYRAANDGRGAKIQNLLKFALESAQRKSGGPGTLMCSEAFAVYLAHQTFANFDPESNSGTASSRHAVGHGAASQESYTMVRALQVILTLDQLAFYT